MLHQDEEVLPALQWSAELPALEQEQEQVYLIPQVQAKRNEVVDRPEVEIELEFELAVVLSPRDSSEHQLSSLDGRRRG